MKNIYVELKNHKKKYPLSICFRSKKHASIIEKHINEGEELLYVFCGQKNESSFMIINSCVIALTNKRILIGQKRLLWGYFFTTITPDLYNDLKVSKGLLWCDIEIDTVKENVYLTNIDPKAAIEIETVISDFMMEEKKKYDKKD